MTREYSERSIADYPRYPLKSLYGRLKALSDECSGLDSIESHIECIFVNVKSKLRDRLLNLKAAGACLEKGMQNEGLLELRKAFISLPAEIDINDGLEEDPIAFFEKEY